METITRTVLRYPLTDFTTEGDIDIATIKVPASHRPFHPPGVFSTAEVLRVGTGTSERICAWVEHDDVRGMTDAERIAAGSMLLDLRFAFVPTGGTVPEDGEYQSTVTVPSLDGSGIRHVYLLVAPV